MDWAGLLRWDEKGERKQAAERGWAKTKE